MSELSDRARGHVVVLGVGHALKADDAAGSVVAEELHSRFPERAFDGGQAPENYMGPLRLSAPDTVFVVDAADFGGRPGEVRVASGSEVEGLMVGTHAPPLSILMALISEETGADVYLVAIQAASTELGGTMTPGVRAAIPGLVAELGRIMEN